MDAEAKHGAITILSSFLPFIFDRLCGFYALLSFLSFPLFFFFIQLRKPFYISSYVRYVTLPLAYDANIFQRYTEPCTVVGWGRHIPESDVRS